MNSLKLRQEFLDFFEKKGHKIVSSSSLLSSDPTVLFTTAGMQQFKEYFLGKTSPYGGKITSCQKCFRTSDIEEVGNNTHLTFLEMLGNFSFGEYFKKEAIEWAYQFITKKIGLEIDYVSIFTGDREIPEDKESEKIWQDLGLPKEKIKKFGREDNFWGPTGEEGPCGPTTEIYIKGIEIWNLVFNEYYQDKDKKLTPLKQKGVDTGMGLERLAMVSQGKKSVFETDLFELIISEIKKNTTKSYKLNLKPFRIITDHIKSAVFLAAEGVVPSNVERGYVLRRLLRRIIRYGKSLNLPKNFSISLTQKVIEIYKDIYPEVRLRETDILTIIQNEEEKFEKTLEKGSIEAASQIAKTGKLTGDIAFNLYESHGMPLEISKEIAFEKGFKTSKNLELDFKKLIKKHQKISRAGRKKKFGGIGKEATYEATKLHTATHLLHQALRVILGENVKQMGSDITSQRLRFDFSHTSKMTGEQIKKVEEIVNQKIKEDLKVREKETSYTDAVKSGALAFFKEKYPERVMVYSIGNFSKEICAGPHVKKTSELGYFEIIKEESSGSGVRRIRAILRN